MVTAAEGAANEYHVRPVSGPAILINIAVQNNTQGNTLWSAAILKESIEMGNLAPTAPAITLFHWEAQRGADRDIIWEGRRYIPIGWKLVISATNNLVAADQLYIHGGYEAV